MAERLNERIENLIAEVSYHLSNLPAIECEPKAFFPSYVKVEEVNLRGNDKLIARIILGILKNPAEIQGVTFPQKFNHIKQYWDACIATTLENSEVINVERATNMIEVKQDLREIYRINVIRPIIARLEKLYEEFAELGKEEKKDFKIPTSMVQTSYEQIKKAQYLVVADLLKTIFLDKKRVRMLDQHDLERKFDTNLPLEFEFVRRIDLA